MNLESGEHSSFAIVEQKCFKWDMFKTPKCLINLINIDTTNIKFQSCFKKQFRQ